MLGELSPILISFLYLHLFYFLEYYSKLLILDDLLSIIWVDSLYIPEQFFNLHLALSHYLYFCLSQCVCACVIFVFVHHFPVPQGEVAILLTIDH